MMSGMQHWLERSRLLLLEACTPFGIRASITKKDNYRAIFTRDAVMAGIAGLAMSDQGIVRGLHSTLSMLMELQGKQGQIPSNFSIKDGKVEKVSFGSLSPKIDSCTWYLIGVGLMIRDGRIEAAEYRESIEQTIWLLDALEYNDKNLVYVPKGGNWADEYIYDGYILYDQLLRAWGLSLLGEVYLNDEWKNKSNTILEITKAKYQDQSSSHFYSSIYPGGTFSAFDLAAHAIAAVVFDGHNDGLSQALDWIDEMFLQQSKLPPVFYPIINAGDKDWDTLSKYYLYSFKNKPYHFHNGGIWWIWLGWLAVGLSLQKKTAMLNRLIELSMSYLDNVENFDFDEYVSSDDMKLNGTKKLCFTAAGISFLQLANSTFDFKFLRASGLS